MPAPMRDVTLLPDALRQRYATRRYYALLCSYGERADARAL